MIINKVKKKIKLKMIKYIIHKKEAKVVVEINIKIKVLKKIIIMLNQILIIKSIKVTLIHNEFKTTIIYMIIPIEIILKN